jgi:hypothetical protein
VLLKQYMSRNQVSVNLDSGPTAGMVPCVVGTDREHVKWRPGGRRASDCLEPVVTSTFFSFLKIHKYIYMILKNIVNSS